MFLDIFFWPDIFGRIFLAVFFGRFLGRPEADLKGGSGGAGAPPVKVYFPSFPKPLFLRRAGFANWGLFLMQKVGAPKEQNFMCILSDQTPSP